MSLAVPIYPMYLLHKPAREASMCGLTLKTQHSLARYSLKLLLGTTLSIFLEVVSGLCDVVLFYMWIGAISHS